MVKLLGDDIDSLKINEFNNGITIFIIILYSPGREYFIVNMIFIFIFIIYAKCVKSMTVKRAANVFGQIMNATSFCREKSEERHFYTTSGACPAAALPVRPPADRNVGGSWAPAFSGHFKFRKYVKIMDSIFYSASIQIIMAPLCYTWIIAVVWNSLKRNKRKHQRNKWIL